MDCRRGNCNLADRGADLESGVNRQTLTRVKCDALGNKGPKALFVNRHIVDGAGGREGFRVIQSRRIRVNYLRRSSSGVGEFYFRIRYHRAARVCYHRPGDA